MKIKLDVKKCIGCGACQAMCNGKFFEIREDGNSHLISPDEKQAKVEIKGDVEELKVEEKEDCIEDAIEICPVDAIEFEK